MLTNEQFDKWVEILETDVVPFGTGQLYSKTSGCYCALGILACHVLNLELDRSGMEARVPGSDGWTGCILPENIMSRDLVYSVYRVNDSSDKFRPVVSFLRENKARFVE